MLDLEYGIPCGNAELLKGENGKPYIAGCPVAFNLSHSRALVAAAFSSVAKSIGCDIQAEGKKYSVEGLAARAFTADERAWLKQTDSSFFLLWAMKEAYIKYEGKTVFDMAGFSAMPIMPNLKTYSIALGDELYYIAVYPKREFRLILAPSLKNKAQVSRLLVYS